MAKNPRPLSEFELVVMLAVLRVGEQGYSVTLRADIEEHTGQKVARGALYVTLDRLCSKGLLHSWKGDPTAERGGRAKRHYRPTHAGTSAVRGAREALDAMFEGVDLTTKEA